MVRNRRKLIGNRDHGVNIVLLRQRQISLKLLSSYFRTTDLRFDESSPASASNIDDNQSIGSSKIAFPRSAFEFDFGVSANLGGGSDPLS